MGEIEKTCDSKLREAAKELIQYKDRIISEIYTRHFLSTKNITLMDGLSEKRSKFDALWKEIEEKPDNAFDTPFYKEATKIFVDQSRDIISSLEAKLKLKTPNCVTDNKSFFTTCLAEEGMCISDLDNVVEDYKELFRKTKEFESWDINFDKSPDSGQKYIESGTKFKDELDAIASKIFKVPVSTELKIQYNYDSSSFYSMHESNVSFKNFVPQLYAVIAHEGPFGHQLHEKLSEDNYSPNHKDFRLTCEGLAILGENIVLKIIYAGSKPDVAEFLMAHALTHITYHAALEKLLFYDGLDSDTVAERLAPTDEMKKWIKSTVQNCDNDKFRIQRPQMAQYYVGFKKINKISGATHDAIMSNPNLNPDQKKDFLYETIKRMYTGFRRPEIMAREIDLYLRRNKLMPKKI